MRGWSRTADDLPAKLVLAPYQIVWLVTADAPPARPAADVRQQTSFPPNQVGSLGRGAGSADFQSTRPRKKKQAVRHPPIHPGMRVVSTGPSRTAPPDGASATRIARHLALGARRTARGVRPPDGECLIAENLSSRPATGYGCSKRSAAERWRRAMSGGCTTARIANVLPRRGLGY